ncbi:uncharacterized protein PHACADRAFT_257248 [Phanerochaete carnosa HHB-10118-sp]|uniref:Transmembrane protein 19 n=1 Tax=Phanerochaete carnosa (strain HHB-10118-sp) TaxID=650164 RepID=K5V110_PHACS|nr:uncharacterized protein PHACADRAFT_257248 [Phanerochaete carnosa HHB-10118-sp]EKM56171.1 hypothetical protein PHACADRAFT_257248 [Phanerochaete carnosa HHB-10118-sp]
MAVPLRTFGVALIVFYLIGSKATKVGKALKAKLEEGHREAGYRNAAQVLCNSLSAFVASLLWSAYFVPDSAASQVLGNTTPTKPYNFARWCPVDPPQSAHLSRALLFVTLGHFACCLGDTLASELGILSRAPPRLITTFKPVPPGTNGGMSTTGTLASLAGGIIMGLTMSATLLLESSACRREWPAVLLSLVGWGAFGGVFGSLLDSLMGATVQRTRYSSITKRILTDESSEPASNADVKVISGLNLLSNNQVNLLSSILTASLLGYLA